MEILETERLLLRRPRQADEPAIFSRYASDPEATRYMAWPTHRSLDDTRAFLDLSDDVWARWPEAGPPSDVPNLPPGASRDAAIYTLTL